MEPLKPNVNIIDDKKTAFILVDVIDKRMKMHAINAYLKIALYSVVSIAVHFACIKGAEHLGATFLIVLGWVVPFLIFLFGLSKVNPAQKVKNDQSINALLEQLAHLALKDFYKENGFNKYDFSFKMGTSVFHPFRMFGIVRKTKGGYQEIPLMVVVDESTDTFKVVLDEKVIAAEALHIELG